MRIAISGTCFLPKKNQANLIDGIGTYTQNLIRALSTEGVISTPVTFNLNPNDYADDSAIHLPPFYLSSLLPSYFSNQLKDYSLFHATDYRIPRLKNIPVVATLHDAIMLKHPEWANKRRRRLTNFILKHQAHYADHYITISHTVVEDIVHYWSIAPEKISVVYQGIDQTWFEQASASQKQEVLQKYQLPNSFFLCVGTLQPRKNLLRTIQAHQQLPEELRKTHPLIIIGKSGWNTEAILKEIQAHTERNEGLWLHYVPYSDLQVIYQCATALVFASLSEGFGLPIIESFASHTPVITSNLPVTAEIAADGAFLVDPTDIEAIQQAMHELATNTFLKDQLILKGIARAQQFSWQECASKTFQIYKKLIGS